VLVVGCEGTGAAAGRSRSLALGAWARQAGLRAFPPALVENNAPARRRDTNAGPSSGDQRPVLSSPRWATIGQVRA
jgi:hypothetical protein